MKIRKKNSTPTLRHNYLPKSVIPTEKKKKFLLCHIRKRSQAKFNICTAGECVMMEESFSVTRVIIGSGKI